MGWSCHRGAQTVRILLVGEGKLLSKYGDIDKNVRRRRWKELSDTCTHYRGVPVDCTGAHRGSDYTSGYHTRECAHADCRLLPCVAFLFAHRLNAREHLFAGAQGDKLLQEELRRASVVCVVYDVNNDETFDKVTSYWLPEIEHVLGDARQVPVILVGNKSDSNDSHLDVRAFERTLCQRACLRREYYLS